jgi:hypothetical protein
VRLGQDHGEKSLMRLELGVTTCLEEDSIIVYVMFHGGLNACVDARVEGLGFECEDSIIVSLMFHGGLGACVNARV